MWNEEVQQRSVCDDTSFEPSDESSASVPADPPSDESSGDATDSTDPDDSISVAFSDEQCVFFVANEERGSGDGASWENASPYLREAMVAGQANKNRGTCDTIEVKVGRGIYFPSKQCGPQLPSLWRVGTKWWLS